MSLASLKRCLKNLESKVLKEAPRVAIEWHIKKRMILLKGGDLSGQEKRQGTDRQVSSGDRMIEERIKRRKSKIAFKAQQMTYKPIIIND